MACFVFLNGDEIYVKGGGVYGIDVSLPVYDAIIHNIPASWELQPCDLLRLG